MEFWENILDVHVDALGDGSEEIDWEEIHFRNFKCTIETKLRSFYFKVFHKAIAFNEFLFKINRKDSPLCDFCNKFPETIVHVFCECEHVKPIWADLVEIINDKHDMDFVLSNFEKIFGIFKDKFLSYLILCVKYFIYVCKFKKVKPNFLGCKALIKNKRDIEF